MHRLDKRKYNQLREVSIIPDYNKHAEGSALIKFGDTHVICNASVEKAVPRWMQDKKTGWVTAEYGMLPRSTNERMNREAKEVSNSKNHGNTKINWQIIKTGSESGSINWLHDHIDCDVIQADGGTRTASITGGAIALCKALKKIGKENSINNLVAAISVGIYKDELILDLNYEEDSNAQCDVNIVMNDNLDFIEVQGTGEEKAFSKEQFIGLLDLAESGIKDLFKLQHEIINSK